MTSPIMKSPSASPILVIEDSEEDLDTVREAARRTGLSQPIVHAPDGDVARRLLKAGGRGDFDIVLLDLSLPTISGDELLKEIRADPALRSLPVIVLSGSTNVGDCNRCYEAGANAYHVKPVQFHEHLKTLEAIFRYWIEQARLPGRKSIACTI